MKPVKINTNELNNLGILQLLFNQAIDHYPALLFPSNLFNFILITKMKKT